MTELLGIALLVALLTASGAIFLLPWETLAVAGFWLIAAGAVLGVPTGVLYHVRLYQTLHPRGVLPDNWFWNPITYNALLEEGAERRRVMTWCALGAAGFVVMVLGVIALAAAAVLVFVRPG